MKIEIQRQLRQTQRRAGRLCSLQTTQTMRVCAPGGAALQGALHRRGPLQRTAPICAGSAGSAGSAGGGDVLGEETAMRVRSIAAARSYVDSLQEGIEARKTKDNTRVCKHTILVATRTLAVIVFIFDLFDPLTTFISHRPRMVPLSFFLSYNSSSRMLTRCRAQDEEELVARALGLRGSSELTSTQRRYAGQLADSLAKVKHPCSPTALPPSPSFPRCGAAILMKWPPAAESCCDGSQTGGGGDYLPVRTESVRARGLCGQRGGFPGSAGRNE